MRPRLWHRLAWGRWGRSGPGEDRVAMVRVLYWVFVAAPTIALVALALPHSAETNQIGILAVAGCAYGIAAVLIVGFDRLPVWFLVLVVAVGTGLVSGAVYFSGDESSAYALFYLWIGLYSAYFFEARLLAAQIALVAGAYGAVLTVLEPTGVPLDRLVLTLGTLVIAGALIAFLRGRVLALVETLSDAAHTDALTRLPNRRGFERALEIELERSRRGDQPFSILVADVDHFKAVNDRLGHLGGDDALRRIGGTLADGKRLIDTVARIGGEEFALIVPGTESRGGYILAERLRTSLRAAFVSEPVPVTLSVGVAHYPDHGGSVETLLRSADSALYAAKALGRDRCVVYTFELEDTLARMDGREAPGQVGLLLTLSELLDMRKPDTVRHSQTVARYADRAARELGLDEERCARVRLAGLLHDIGKVGIPDVIVGHPGPLGHEEADEMRGHPEIGARLVEGTALEDLAPWIVAHHEQPDGGGYPLGLRGDAIPLEASILSVADAYAAMTTDRVYRPAIGVDAARAELELGAGTQFDARVVRAFLTALERPVPDDADETAHESAGTSRPR